ncbi:hypothetical protein HAX54_007993, partial [Datura stramonium]|nr:hypothetical protein [Datura stramonium]
MPLEAFQVRNFLLVDFALQRTFSLLALASVFRRCGLAHACTTQVQDNLLSILLVWHLRTGGADLQHTGPFPVNSISSYMEPAKR